jgi:hypothetical protein
MLKIMLGFDCDRPRGSFINTPDGLKMANRKLMSLQNITETLNSLNIPRTFFICGQFLESMSNIFGVPCIRECFDIRNPLIEIADHTYSHNVLAPIKTRPDKTPIPIEQVIQEYHFNTNLLKDILDFNISERGYRTPLGHFGGLSNEKLLDAFLELKIRYVSSDLRDTNESINPPVCFNGRPRQPYYYRNGLLEIPSTGWHDTAFSGTSKTPYFVTPPKTYSEIIAYYRALFIEAYQYSQNGKDFFLGLVLHPYDVSFYNEGNRFFYDIFDIATSISATFCRYDYVLKNN